MRPVATAIRYVDLRFSRWRPERSLRRRRRRKLAALARHARDTVPYYRELFQRAGLEGSEIRTLEDLRRLPVTRRTDLVAAGDRVLSSAWPPGALETKRTSGSAGRPMTIRLDPGAVALRRALFLRALREVGWTPGRRLLLLTEDPPRESRPFLRWRYASIHEPPDRHLAHLRRFRPQVVYGPVTPLRRMADVLTASGDDLPRGLELVVPTAESLDPATRRHLAGGFDAHVRELYGLTETGMMGWECPAGGGIHLAEDAAIFEFLERPAAPPGALDRRLVVTHLGLRATPLLRYDTGDLAVPPPAGACGCGHHLARVGAVAGRRVDCVQLAGGEVVSPYRLTSALERVEGLERYQVVQRTPGHLLVRAAAPDRDPDGVAREIRQCLTERLGREIDVDVEQVRASDLDPPTGEKFRVVSSDVEAEGARP